MQALDNQPALPLRSHTILGVCEAIGEDFAFNPLFLRVPFAAVVLLSPIAAIGGYLALGLVVLASRLLFPNGKSKTGNISSDQVTDEQPVAAANDERADGDLRTAA